VFGCVFCFVGAGVVGETLIDLGVLERRETFSCLCECMCVCCVCV
jgi:hypothetical protein